MVGEDDGAVVEKRNVHHTSQHGHTHIQFGNSGVHHVCFVWQFSVDWSILKFLRLQHPLP